MECNLSILNIFWPAFVGPLIALNIYFCLIIYSYKWIKKGMDGEFDEHFAQTDIFSRK